MVNCIYGCGIDSGVSSSDHSEISRSSIIERDLSYKIDSTCGNGLCDQYENKDWCEQDCSFSINTHIVHYGYNSASTINPDDLDFIAKQFTIYDGQLLDARPLKKLNNSMTVLFYDSLSSVHESDPDWITINSNESWFVHDAYGHRLRHDGYCGYLMNPLSNWKYFFANRTRQRIESSHSDGIFLDEVDSYLSQTRYHAEIQSEKAFIESDGKTVFVKYLLWDGISDITWCKHEIGVYTNPDAIGTNYYMGGSYSGHKIILGQELPPGTIVYVSYQANNDSMFNPTHDIVNDWHSGVLDFLRITRTALDDYLFIINSGDKKDFIHEVDGKMDEGFIHPAWYPNGLNISYEKWIKTIDELSSISNSKHYLAQSGVADLSDPIMAREIMMYTFTSYLLGAGKYSTYYFNHNDYGNISYYPEWDAPIGYPSSNYYVFESSNIEYENLIQNPSFENGFDNYEILKRGPNNITPEISEDESFIGNKSVHFKSNGEASSIIGNYFPISPGQYYKLSACVKGNKVATVDGEPWNKILVKLILFDKNRLALESASLVFQETGSFDWICDSKSFRTPDDAFYYRINDIGFAQGGSGDIWIDNIKLTRDYERYGYRIYARNYTNALVLVNPFENNHTVYLDQFYYSLSGQKINTLNIKGHSGAILLKALCNKTGDCDF